MEILDLGTAQAHPSACRVASLAGAAGLDARRLHLALSAGRHAAERARLAGAQRLALWLADDGVPGASGIVSDAYATLGRLGRPGLAVLAGACIASAQLGVPLRALSPGAARAARLACGIHPGVARWLAGTGLASARSAEPEPLCV